MATVKILIPFIGNTAGKSIVYEAGQIAEVSDGDADNFVRGKYAQYVKAAAPEVDAVKITNKPKALNSKSIKGK